jgi:pimeloyl-ACP methyl ester carboxylesterase
MAIMQDLSSHEKTTGQPTSAGRVIRAALMVSVALLILLGLTLYYRPFAVLDRVTRARLYAAGMQNQDVLIDGHRIHYLVGGTGKPIVLVHGLGSRASDWVGLIPPLVHGGHRIYAIDLLGYGQSDRPADAPYSIPQEARIVEDFLQAEHLQHVDLAGWSMGGWISMVVATDMPQRIDRLVLLDSAGLRFQPDFDPSLFTPTDLDQLHQLMHLLSPAAPAMPAFLARAFLKRARPDAWVIRRSVNAMLTGDDLLDNKLHELTMPVLIVWGKDDHLTPLALAYTLHAGVPGSKLQLIDGCGHLAPGLCAGRIAPDMVSFLNGSEVQHETRQDDASLQSPQTSRSSLSGFWGLFAGAGTKDAHPPGATPASATATPNRSAGR